MLIERQISVALAGISAALVLPAYGPILADKPAAAAGSPGVLFVGTLLGALAILMGSLLSVDELEGTTGGRRLLPLAKTIVWSAFALCVSAGTGMTAMHAQGTGWRIALGVAALLPLAGLAPALIRSRIKF
ncbi:MAG TPA: hypothetical protein VI298_13995 [Geobacteraceae bacterium]